MSKAMRKSTRRGIFSSVGRFFAIFAIIAIGVAFFSGIRVSKDTMIHAGNEYIENQNMFDFRIISPVGVNASELEAFMAEDNILLAEGAFLSDALSYLEGNDERVMRFHSLTPNINKLKYTYGRAPINGDECVLDARFYGEEDIGKTLYISSSNDEETSDSFKFLSFTVVGVANSPCYLNYERGNSDIGGGSVSSFVYLKEEAFAREEGLYDELFIDFNLSGKIYSDEYQSLLDAAKIRIEEACGRIFKSRTVDVLAALRDELDLKKAELDADEEFLIKKKSEGEKALEDKLASLNKARSDYEASKKLYDERFAPLSADKTALESEISRLEGLLESAEGNDALEINYTLTAYKYRLDELNAELSPLLLFAETGEQTLIKINDAFSAYNKEKKAFEDEIADGEKKIKEARLEIADRYEFASSEVNWSLLSQTRLQNTGYVCFDNDTEIVNAMGRIFPIFFFAVAVLVCMTTMTRMIEEERTQIGTFKALGLRNREIRGKYVTYSGLASALGCAVGFILGTKFLPLCIWSIYTVIYDFGANVEYVFDPINLAISLASSLICSVGVTVFCLRRILRSSPALLMRPKAPENGGRILFERIGFIWKRLSFMQKVTARNIFRYKKRMLMMLIGIGGCTALMLTGFGMYDSICNIVKYQYDDVTTYDISVLLPEEYKDSKKFSEDFSEAYSDIDNYLPIHQASADITFDNIQKSATMFIPREGSFSSFMNLALEGKEVPFPGTGEVAVSIGLAESLGISVGDKITLGNKNYRSYSFTVSAVFDNYVSNYVILSPETFEAAGGRVSYNSILINAKRGIDSMALGAKLSSSGNTLNVTVIDQVKERTSAMLNNMFYLIIIVVLSAASLAVVVLYNLTNIHITEREREIATLRVMGLHKRECRSYIFRENTILTFCGALLGIPLGILLHSYCMDKVRVEAIRFDIQIAPQSFTIAIALTMIFSVTVSFFMRRKVTAGEMVSALKSIE